MVEELPPLHHHHGELVRVVRLVPVDAAQNRIKDRPSQHSSAPAADQAGVGKGTVAARPEKKLIQSDN